VEKAHLKRIPMTSWVAIFKVDHLVRQFCKNLRSLTLCKFQQCLPHPLVLGKDNAYRKFIPGTVPKDNSTLEVDFDDDIDNLLTPIDISRSRAVALHKE
jgi:hypothetical protein